MTEETVIEILKEEIATYKYNLNDSPRSEYLGQATRNIYEERISALEMAIKALEQEQKTGQWIEDAKTYYEELNKRGLDVDEYTPYFTDDIACSECLAKYSMLDNETQFFKYCPNCGAKMQAESEG